MDFIHMYIMDLLLNETPWLNSSDACDLINSGSVHKTRDFLESDPEESCIVCEAKPFMFDQQKTFRNITADDVVGTYGHYAYGNATIVVDDFTEQLLFVYGKEGKYNWTWELTAADETGFDYTGLSL